MCVCRGSGKREVLQGLSKLREESSPIILQHSVLSDLKGTAVTVIRGDELETGLLSVRDDFRVCP